MCNQLSIFDKKTIFMSDPRKIPRRVVPKKPKKPGAFSFTKILKIWAFFNFIRLVNQFPPRAGAVPLGM